MRAQHPRTKGNVVAREICLYPNFKGLIMKPVMHERQQPELSQLQRQLLGQGDVVKFYTQQEFDASLAMAKAEIMTVAIQTTKQALFIERQACAELIYKLAEGQTDPATKRLLEDASESILDRIPSQRQ
jgi:uncharacterized phosphosugar-binding protein